MSLPERSLSILKTLMLWYHMLLETPKDSKPMLTTYTHDPLLKDK